MINITVQKEANLYNVYHMTKAFYPFLEIQQKVDEKASHFVTIEIVGEKILTFDSMEKHKFDKMLYQSLCQHSGRKLAWGTLLGVRPTKLVTRAIEEGKTKEKVIEELREDRYVSEGKATLAYEIAMREEAILRPLDYENGYSLYIGIPFCPSICSYCSFSSGVYDIYKEMISDYIDTLEKEMQDVAEHLRDKKLNTIYIGGGTPTALKEQELCRVLELIKKYFPLGDLLEYTIEAGRPDSITPEKLDIIKEHPVSRLSINPQTMQQKTLDAIGRNHTIDQIYSTYERAREKGFSNINMDLILGLPGEELTDVKDTFAKIKTLAPDSLTVHTLAIKRASRLMQIETPGQTIEDMIHISQITAKEMNLLPYYLYRQKNIGGNFENIGYSKVDKAGIYNILIMEEKQSIIACGAGATTKQRLKEKVIYKGKETNLIRTDNVKDIKQYIKRGATEKWR